MQGQSRSGLALCAALLLGGALSACVTDFTTFAPTPPKHFEKLGQASGSACGSMLLFAAPVAFIPLDLNDRVQRAYDNAVGSVPGATGLIDATMQEDWFWWGLGTNRCVTVKGEAIK
jgi:hypothetical protein